MKLQLTDVIIGKRVTFRKPQLSSMKPAKGSNVGIFRTNM